MLAQGLISIFLCLLHWQVGSLPLEQPGKSTYIRVYTWIYTSMHTCVCIYLSITSYTSNIKPGKLGEKVFQALDVSAFPDFGTCSPGQGKMLHSWYSRDGPRQGMPPNLGSGLLQTRFRFRMPRLQSRLHCDHDVQADHAPLTVWAEYLPARRKSPDRPAKEMATCDFVSSS